MKKKTKERRSNERIQPTQFLATTRVGDFEYRAPVHNISAGGMLVLGYAAPLEEQPTKVLLRNTKHEIEITARAIGTRTVNGRLGVAYAFTGKKPSLRSFLRDLEKNSTG